MSLITLTTDFGSSDWFVGTMKGAIAKLAPEAGVIDITHGISPGDVRAGAFALGAAAPFFPEGTVHVAVVDPGVGSAREAIAVRGGGVTFVGPDNGLLSWALRDVEIDEIRVLSNVEWFLHPVSHTFHGRDVFAPVAARLAAGARFEEAGELAGDIVRLPWPEVERGDGVLRGEVLYVDCFGNAITNLPADELPAIGEVRVQCGDVAARVVSCYADGAENEVIALAGSSGFVELAINGGDFSSRLGVDAGATVEAQW